MSLSIHRTPVSAQGILKYLDSHGDMEQLLLITTSTNCEGNLKNGRTYLQ
jgi:hypothetical protein